METDKAQTRQPLLGAVSVDKIAVLFVGKMARHQTYSEAHYPPLTTIFVDNCEVNWYEVRCSLHSDKRQDAFSICTPPMTEVLVDIRDVRR